MRSAAPLADASLRRRRSPDALGVPAWVVAVAVVAVAVTACLTVAGALRVGATWDEYGLARFLESYLSNGWFAEPTAIRDGIPDLSQIWYLYSYGPVALLPGHLASVLSGTSTFSVPGLEPGAFAARHLGTVLWAVVGVVAVAIAVRVLLRSWRWALVAAATLMAIPLWSGHAMFNPKDVPVAAAYSAGMLAATLMCVPSETRRRRAITIVLLALALVLGAGTRPFAGLMIGASVIGALVFRVLWARLAHVLIDRPWRPFADVAISGALAYAALLAIYPRLFSDPSALGVGAYLEARQFSFQESVITAGQWIEQPVPWWYLPAWFAAQLPILVFVGAAAGLVGWIILALWGMRPHGPVGARFVLGLAPWVIQAFGAAVLAMATGATIYNGTRQYLFMVPALAVVATGGIALAFAWTARRSRSWLTHGLWGLVVLGIAVPMFAQVQLHPYSYAYFNAATIASGSVDGNWPTDYWRASGRELWQRVPASGEEACAYEQGLWDRQASCAVEQMFLPYVTERGLQATATTTMADGVWVVRENQGVVEPPRGCRVADALERWNLWQRVTIGQILECPRGTPFPAFAYPPPPA